MRNSAEKTIANGLNSSCIEFLLILRCKTPSKHVMQYSCITSSAPIKSSRHKMTALKIIFCRLHALSADEYPDTDWVDAYSLIFSGNPRVQLRLIHPATKKWVKIRHCPHFSFFLYFYFKAVSTFYSPWRYNLSQ